MSAFTRRAFVVASVTTLVAACQSRRPGPLIQTSQPRPGGRYAQPAAPAAPSYAPVEPPSFETGDPTALYAPVNDRFPIPGVKPNEINPGFYRKVVDYYGPEAPGTIVVDPGRRYLYLVQPGKRAIRYGVGVGREGFGWSGEAVIQNKQEWPDWYPPKEMVARQPELRRVVTKLPSGEGVPGGPRNPLGARAMYLYQNGKDTLFRIHGTTEPWTIGQRVSSGCIRLVNQDILDLYSRVPVGTKVVVIQSAGFAKLGN